MSQWDWYLLSIGMQRMYVVFLLDTQNPMKMHSYANITCERETFKEVIICRHTLPFQITFIFIFRLLGRHSHIFWRCAKWGHRRSWFNSVDQSKIPEYHLFCIKYLYFLKMIWLNFYDSRCEIRDICLQQARWSDSALHYIVSVLLSLFTFFAEMMKYKEMWSSGIL